MFAYWAFGMMIQSELAFPEFFPFGFDGEADVRLTAHLSGTDDQVFADPELTHRPADANRYVLYVKGVATYVVEDGYKIAVYVHPGSEPGAVRLYCLSNAFAALLYQRGKIPLHASALKIKTGAALFLGDSGAGKSTLLMKLMSKGGEIFSDDVCVPIFDDEHHDLLVQASYPMIKCWSNTLNRLEIPYASAHKLKLDMDKYGVYFHDQFIGSPLKPQFVFLIEKSDAIDCLKIRSVGGRELFSRLAMQVYRREHLNTPDRKSALFQVLTKLSAQVSAYVITRPSSQDSIDDMALEVSRKIKM